MLAFPALQMSQSKLTCQFITVHHAAIDGSGNSVPSLTGASAGDLAVVIGVAGLTTPPSGWTLVGSFTAGSYTCPIFAKVLTSGDISSPPTFTGGTGGLYTALIYRGPKSVSLLGNNPWTTTDTSKGIGAAKVAGTKGVVVAALSSNNTGPGSGSPTGTTLRDSFNTGAAGIGAADITAALKYGGGVLTWTSIPSGTAGAVCLLALV